VKRIGNTTGLSTEQLEPGVGCGRWWLVEGELAGLVLGMVLGMAVAVAVGVAALVPVSTKREERKRKKKPQAIGLPRPRRIAAMR
jgi:hypothetical protein